MNDSTSTRDPITALNGAQFKRLMAGALAWLEQTYEHVNQLNVFPVPDGDTGTNMLLTIKNAYKEIAAYESADVGALSVRFAHGALRGARGNSGTILSEMLRGFANEMSGCKAADGALLIKGLREAVRLAYLAAPKPAVEGTILTVARELTEAFEGAIQENADLVEALRRAVVRSRESVARTPELLPILKKSGVVDSGGQGLADLFEGMLRQARGESLTPSPSDVSAVGDLRQTLTASDPEGYGYDVQFLLKGQNLDIEAVRAAIGAMGDSMIVVGDSSLIKVHVHVHDPGKPLSYGVSLGVIEDIVVENMQAQAEEYIAERLSEPSGEDRTIPDTQVTVTPGEIAVVAVVPGDGLQRVFRGLGVAGVVNGGQTMNPSTGEILDMIAGLDTDKIVILPNNKNIQLTAEQAAKTISGKRVAVVPTRTVPQGIAAMLSFNAEGELDSVIEAMSAARLNVITGEVTRATRSVLMDGVDVREGQLIGLADGIIAASGADMATVVRHLLWRMNVTDRELVTLYYGAAVTAAEADQLAEAMHEAYPAQDFEVFQGGQPHYDYILSAE